MTPATVTPRSGVAERLSRLLRVPTVVVCGTTALVAAALLLSVVPRQAFTDPSRSTPVDAAPGARSAG